MGVSKERIAIEYIKIPKDERLKIDQIRNDKDYRFWWGESSPELLELAEFRRKILRFKSIKAINEYLNQPKEERVIILDEILMCTEKAKKYRLDQEKKRCQLEKENREKLKEKTNQQIQDLAIMYKEASKVRLLYGEDSEAHQLIIKKIDKYSKELNLESTMACISIIPSALMKAVSELKKDPSTKKRVTEQWLYERMKIHDNEKIVTYERSYCKEYRVILSRSFRRDEEIIHVSGSFTCIIYPKNNNVYIQHYNLCTTGLNNFCSCELPSQSVSINLKLNRMELFNYVSDNLTTLFGEGASSKSIDSLFSWYDRNVGEV